jgi:hypothetical protein
MEAFDEVARDLRIEVGPCLVDIQSVSVLPRSWRYISVILKPGRLADFTTLRSPVFRVEIGSCVVQSRRAVVLSRTQMLNQTNSTFLCFSSGSSYFDLIE